MKKEVKDNKKDINKQNKVFENMEKWTSNIWRQSRIEANSQIAKTAKKLKYLSAKEQIDIMIEQTNQAERIMSEQIK